MKKYIFVLILCISAGYIYGQTSVSSAPIKIISMGADTLTNIPKAVYPPLLEITNVSFTSTSNENFVSMEEAGYLHFTIINAGRGDAYNLRLYASETSGISGLKYDNLKFIAKQLTPGTRRTDSIFIEGRNNLRDGRARFELILSEANGHKSPIAGIWVPTRASSKPNIDMLDYEIFRMNDREFGIQMTIINNSSSTINDIKVQIDYPKTVYVKGSHFKTVPTLKPDESVQLDYVFVKNQYFNEMTKDEFNINFEDNNGRQLGLQRKIVRTSTPTAVDNRGNTSAYSRSDVDVNIPFSTNEVKNNHIYALVIGNEKYAGNQDVPYAVNDSRAFAEYCVRTFNIPRNNVTILTNATGNQMKEGLRTLARKALYDTDTEAEVIIYYSGHGVIAKDKYSMADDEFDQYLIPVDVSGADPSLSLSRKDIYAALNEIPLKRASIFLDACNIKGDRAVSKVARYEWKGNVFVFASSSASQSSTAYNEKEHGLFTYFLLKSIQDKKGKIEYKDLTDMVIRNVERQSDNMSDKIQTPEIITSPQIGDAWKRWKVPE